MNKLHRLLLLLTTLGLLATASGALATGAMAAKGPRDVAVRHTGTDYNNGQALPIGSKKVKIGQPPLGPAKVGSVRTWLGLDDTTGAINLKNYTLRGVGDKIEVWVANNLNFPNPNMLNPLTADPTDFFDYNDCRNDGVRNKVTDDQVDHLITEFDTNMYPIESDWWGTPPNRNGKHAVLPKLIPNIPSSEYKGEGDNVVVLVDNVRDDNFYDKNNAGTKSYIAGFYWSVFDDYFDRTVMSIDAWDWIHRTGADPLHEPTTNPCTSAPARPFLYEGVFAHEYQHLLHHYTDPNEVNWVNEGLSDFSEVITGYADLSVHVDEKGSEGHTQAYLGWRQVFHPQWNPIPEDMGAENGLTAWEDQGGDEVLADYGAAMFFMNYLHSQPGLNKAFFTAFFEEQANGIIGLDNVLDGINAGTDFQTLLEDDLIAALVDGYIDNGATVAGGTAGQFSNDAAEATILTTAQAHAKPGAPPWGADYIDLGAGSELDSVVFNGDELFVFPDGTDWVVDGNGYYTTPDVGETGEYGSDFDASMARSVAGHDGEVLSFDHYYAMELAWDYGFVQVSTDGGDSWQSLACSGTTTEQDPGALGTITANLPGFTGPSADDTVTTTIGTAGAPVHVTCPALPAGVDYLAFRLMTDELAHFDGWHVKNIQLNGANLGTPGGLAGWDNQAFFNPTELTFGAALVGINGTVDEFGDVTDGDAIRVVRPELGADNAVDFNLDNLAGFDRVVAVIWGIPDDESTFLYQPYSLRVNGTQMADGG